jgi:aryl-alcohol dehydrogenase-like predicted oxidoreductase
VTIVGKAIAGRDLRSRVIIAVKVELGWGKSRVSRDATRARALQEMEDSLRRAQTDYIEIFQTHWRDALVAIEGLAEAMHTLLRQGKIRAIGVSSFSVEQMERFRKIAPIHVLQSPYNLFERKTGAEVLPYCRANEITTFGYGALCRVLQFGRMRKDSAFEGDNLRRINPKFRGPKFIKLAARWVLDQGVGTGLCGARRPDQLQPVDGVMGWRWMRPRWRRSTGSCARRLAIPSAPNSWRRPRAAWRRDAVSRRSENGKAVAPQLIVGRWSADAMNHQDTYQGIEMRN